MIDRDVFGNPACLLGAMVGVGVDPTDAPVRVGHAQGVGDVAEVLTCGLLGDVPCAICEVVREGRSNPFSGRRRRCR